MSWQNALVDYAQTTAPSKLPKDVYLTHSPNTLTIFDKFPKAMFHFLCLPRLPFEIQEEVTKSVVEVPKPTLNNLAALVGSRYAFQVLKVLKEASLEVIEIIEEEMLKREGFKWLISVGFHAIESMAHVHLHIISQDFISDSLKNKKHWNSFNPKHGFFLHLDDVLDWVENKTMKQHSRPKSGYEKLLTGPLQCYSCGETFSTIPRLKDHLKRDFERLKADSSVKAQHGDSRNGKRTVSPALASGVSAGQADTTSSEDSQPPAKKARIDDNERATGNIELLRQEQRRGR